MLELFMVMAVSAVVCFLLCAPLIWIFRTFKIGQSIREEGPERHKLKMGTPTMGGLAIILTLLVITLILVDVDLQPKFMALLGLIMGYSLIGLIDDLIKIIRQKNQGLRGWQKLSLQGILALAFGIFLIFLGHHTHVSGILKILCFNSPWLYLPFIMFVIVGAANATNLTDGLDGLASGTLFLAFLAYGAISLKLELGDLSIFCAVAAGATLAFLYFNFYPARIFLGDVGSIGLGAALAGAAILAHKELLLAIIGGIFVVEALSVIAQVISFKTRGKRIFKMSPLHHHFELSGWKELKVVAVFWLVGAILAGLGIWLG